MLVLAGVASSPLFSAPAGASPPALQACTANNVKISTVFLGEANGHELEAFKLRNTGSSTCGLQGYPELTFFTASRLDSRIEVVHDASGYADVTPRLLAIGLSYRNTIMTSPSFAKDCQVESILIDLPLAPTSSGDFAYHQSFNACEAGNVVAITPVEARTLPKRATA
jgi:hypothetical protein